MTVQESTAWDSDRRLQSRSTAPRAAGNKSPTGRPARRVRRARAGRSAEGAVRVAMRILLQRVCLRGLGGRNREMKLEPMVAKRAWTGEFRGLPRQAVRFSMGLSRLRLRNAGGLDLSTAEDWEMGEVHWVMIHELMDWLDLELD